MGGLPLWWCGWWGAGAATAQHQERVSYHLPPAWEKVEIQNSTYDFYWMCAIFALWQSWKVVSRTIIRWRPSVLRLTWKTNTSFSKSPPESCPITSGSSSRRDAFLFNLGFPVKLLVDFPLDASEALISSWEERWGRPLRVSERFWHNREGSEAPS